MALDPFVLAYAVIYLLALLLAYRDRKRFPLGDSVMVILVVGFGFTALVHWVLPPPETEPALPPASTGGVIFALAYLALLAGLLTRQRPMPAAWRGDFRKEKIATLVFKLVFFVALPLLALRVFWSAEWASLGFTWGDIPRQLRATGILVLVIGGFNLLAGSGAAPLRARKFSARQVALGGVITMLWNIFEVGLVEEFFFRAFLQEQLVGVLGSPWSGIVVASLLFGLAHAPGLYLRGADKGGPLGEHPTLLNSVLYSILVLSVAGWFTGLLYWRTQSLLAPILVHAALDSVAQVAEYIEGLKLPR